MKRFIVSDLGSTPVTLGNGAFLFCKQLERVNALKVGETISAEFQSGRGTNRSAITRVEDGESEKPVNGQTYCSQCGSLVCGHSR